MNHKTVLILSFLFALFVRLTTSSELNMQLLLIIEGKNDGNLLGRSIEAAGDINNDGYPDFLIGVPGADSSRGAVCIYFGSENLNNMRKEILYGEDYTDHFGNEIANIGDINGDSYNDFVIGAPGANSDTGKAYLYLGQGSEQLLCAAIYEGENDNDQFGAFIDGGDINGDNYSDVLIVSPTYDHSRGKIYVFLGGEKLPSIPYITYEGDSIRTYLGGILSIVGDINNDGYDDFVTGSSSRTINGMRAAGYFRVYFGSSDLDTIPDIEVTGNYYLMRLGYSVCSGDFNGDSLDDFIVCSAGNGFVYFGKDSFTSEPDIIIGDENVPIALLETAGDINGDGYDDFLSGLPGLYGNNGAVDLFIGSSSLDGIPELRIHGNWASYFGWPVSSAGDLNRDGCDEFIVGEPNYFLGIFNQGRVYVYSGDSTITGIDVDYEQINILGDYKLGQNYPNPFNDSTVIPYSVSSKSTIQIRIFNLLGKEIISYTKEHSLPGQYNIIWNGKDRYEVQQYSGIYLYQIIINKYKGDVKKMLLIK